MRKRPAIALAGAAALGLMAWAWAVLQADTIEITSDGTVGGLSGLVVSDDGLRFTAIGDQNLYVEGRLLREGGRLTGAEVDSIRVLGDWKGRPMISSWRDAEGLDLTPEGLPVVSFENQLRVMRFDAELRGTAMSPLPPMRIDSENQVFEALALDAAGRVVLISEYPLKGESAAAVLRQSGEDWDRLGDLTLDGGFHPTGSDFAPDGSLIVLERRVGLSGFRSRLRRVELTGGLMTGEVLWTSAVSHGNLEGLSVWTDAEGALRATMIADDNFLPLMAGGFTEITLANKAPAE